MSDPSPAMLPVFCVRCGQPVKLHFEEWTSGALGLLQVWECPWCHEQNDGKFPGKLTGTSKTYPSQS